MTTPITINRSQFWFTVGLSVILLVSNAINYRREQQAIGQAGIVGQSTFNAEVVWEQLNLEARGAAVYDLASQKFLFSHHDNQQLPIASLTKLMTAVTAEVNLPSTTAINFLNRQWQPEELIGYMLVSSSNEAAEALAATLEKHTGRSAKDLMNEQAVRLGLNSTYFLNATGLDIDHSQPGALSSANDMVKLRVYLLEDKPTLAAASREPLAGFQTLDDKQVWTENTNPLTRVRSDLLLSKTGLTTTANGNLAIAFDRGLNQPVIAVIIGSSRAGRFSDMEKLIAATEQYYLSF